jgi:phage protein U
MRGRKGLRSSFERYGHARRNGISLRLARWDRIYILLERVRKQNEVASCAFIRYRELIG